MNREKAEFLKMTRPSLSVYQWWLCAGGVLAEILENTDRCNNKAIFIVGYKYDRNDQGVVCLRKSYGTIDASDLIKCVYDPKDHNDETISKANLDRLFAERKKMFEDGEQKSESVMLMSHQINFKIGEIVFLRTDNDNMERMVTGITLRPNGQVIYGLTSGTQETIHYEIEITRERSF